MQPDRIAYGFQELAVPAALASGAEAFFFIVRQHAFRNKIAEHIVQEPDGIFHPLVLAGNRDHCMVGMLVKVNFSTEDPGLTANFYVRNQLRIVCC